MNSGMGVSLNPLDWFESQDTVDLKNGDKVLEAYFSAASFYPENFSFNSYQDYKDYLGGDFVARNLGANVRANMHPGLLDVIYFPYDDAAKRVGDLATSTRGQASIDQINQAAIDHTVDALSAVGNAISTSVTNVAAGVSNTSTLLRYLPLILIAGGGAYMYMLYKEGSLLSKVVKR